MWYQVCGSYLFLLKLHLSLFYNFFYFIVLTTYIKEPLKYSLVDWVVVWFTMILLLFIVSSFKGCIKFVFIYISCSSWPRIGDVFASVLLVFCFKEAHFFFKSLFTSWRFFAVASNILPKKGNKKKKIFQCYQSANTRLS